MNKSNRFRMGSFKIFDLMLNQRNIHELTCRFAVVLLLTCQCLADDGYEMDDFLKREYSLTKPYQGRLPNALLALVSQSVTIVLLSRQCSQTFTFVVYKNTIEVFSR